MIHSKHAYIALTLLAICASTAFANEAESLYQKGDYETASQQFEAKIRENPEDLAIQYNLGNSRYKSGKFDQALESYQQSGTALQNPELQQFAVYNSGNALFKMGKLKEAEAAFKKSLELNPKDMDAKFNLEFVRKQLEEQKKKRPQNDPKQQNQNQKPQDNKDPDQTKSAQQEGADSEDQQHNPPQSNRSGKTQTAKNQPPRTGEGKLSREEADRRLNAISENRKELIQKQIAKNQASKHPPKVDW